MKLSEVPEGQMVRFPYGHLDGRVADVDGTRLLIAEEGFRFEPVNPDAEVQLLNIMEAEDFVSAKLLQPGDEIEIDGLGQFQLERIHTRAVTHVDADFAWIETAYVFTQQGMTMRTMIDSHDFLGYFQQGQARRVAKVKT